MARKLLKIALIALITCLIIVLPPLPPNFGENPKIPSQRIETPIIAQTVEDKKAEADRLFDLGIQQLQTSQYREALQSWENALKIYREIGDRRGEANSLGNLGIAYRLLGQYQKAIEYHQQSLAIAREIGDRGGEAAFLGSLGNAYTSLGQYQKAIKYHQQALAIAREIGNREGEAKSLGNLGGAYTSLGQYQKAIEYHQQSLAIAREIGDRQWEAGTLGNLGNVYYSLGQHQKAIEYHQQALTIAREIGNRLGETISLGNIGLAYTSLGQYQKAIEYHQQALAIAREIGDREGEAKSLGNLGGAYTFLGQYQKAIEYHQQSLAIAREIGDRQWEARTLGNLGIAYYSLGQYQKAIEYHQQSLAIAREIGDRQWEAGTLGNLGIAYSSLEQYQKAIEYYQQYLVSAREIGDRGGEAKSLGNIGLAYTFLGQYQKAIEYQQQSLAIVREIGDRGGEAISLNNIGLAYLNLKQYTEATQFLSEAVEILESLRFDLPDTAKISIFDTQARSYRLLQLILIAQNKTQEALEISERGRARAFVELLASKQNNNPEKIEPITLAQIQQVAKEQNATLVEYSLVFDALYIWVIKPSGEITFTKTEFPSNLPITALVETSREAIGVRGGLEVRERPYIAGDRVKLKDDTENGFQEPWQVVNYDATNNLLTLTHPTFDGSATISRPISDVSEKVTSAPISKKPLQDLYKILIDPIADQLPTNPDENIIFIPHGELFLIPFVALQDEQGKYLIEKHTILIAPAIQILQLTHVGANGVRPKDNRPENALIVGNPTMPIIPLTEPPERLSSLPNAEREAITIAKLLNTTPILGKEATKANILPKMQTASLIHLATHGLLDDIKQLGTPGAIALAPTADDDGFLSAAEIVNMKLKADLVVLSACNTGQGNITGDGVVGLSRSLMTAGASSVIVSLWNIPDAPTADLMSQFYQNRQKMNKAQALRQAMLSTMKQHREPINWAAFTLLGEAE